MSDSQHEDKMLIERAQQGDRASLNALIRKYETKAFQFSYRLTRNQEEAADIVAEAFVRVYNALPNFKGQSSFTTWLYRILTNCFLDARKRERNKVTTSLEAVMRTDEGEVERQIEDPGLSPHQEAEKNERDRRVQRAIGQLPDYQRAMIVMYHVELLSYEDIAAALDLPIGTVKSRLNRARLSLRELLVRDEELFKV